MKVFTAFPDNYELIDAGGGRKLERWGTIVTIRPEHQAYFAPVYSAKEWKEKAHWEFIPVTEGALQGKWKPLKEKAPNSWIFHSNQLQFQLELTSNKHIGIFPEQGINWEFIRDKLTANHRFLNAFAYTGAASVIGKSTGAEVIHVDSVRTMLDWGRTNMEINHLDGIKWVLEDALKFVQREAKRGNTYDLVQLDPPAWGLGAKKEKWKLEDLLPTLIREALNILTPKGTLIVNTYSPKVTEGFMKQYLQTLGSSFTSEVNELWMESTTEKKLFFGVLTRIHKNG